MTTTRTAAALDELDQRYHPAAGMRKQFNKVFPTHWSFMLGEIALYSFVVLLLSGIYLGLFYDPSMAEVVYNGPFDNLRGVTMSRAYESSIDISLQVRGGLFVRQIHHWSALLFLAAMFVHMFRTYFTGAFRKPREANWVIGIVLILIGTFEGFSGYSLPDDLLSGTGLRIASGITLSVPVVGTWVHWMLFGGEFPGTEIIPRLYIIHVLHPAGTAARVDRGARRAGLVPEAHAVPRRRPYRDERRRRPDPAAVRSQGWGVLRGHGRLHRHHGRDLPDQPDLEHGSLRPRPHLGRLAAGLLHDVVRRHGPDLPALGVLPVRAVHDPVGVPADGGVPAGAVRDRGRLPVPGTALHRRPRRCTTCSNARGTSPYAPRWARWASGSTWCS